MSMARGELNLALILALALATSCTAAVRPSPTAAPFDTGFVTQGNDVSRIVHVGDIAHTCSRMSGGSASMAGLLPVYPRATWTFGGSDVPSGTMRIFESDDSWQTIARWYRHALPQGSERMMKPGCQELLPKNMPAPEVALFSVGRPGKDYRAVLITGFPEGARPHGWPAGKKVPRTVIMLDGR